MAADAGGIALLSMYNDEEEDDDEQEPEANAGAGGSADAVADGESKNDGVAPPPEPAIERSSPYLGPRYPLLPDEGADDKTLKSPVARSPTPPPFRPFQHSSPFPLTSPSPPPPALPPPPSSFVEPVDALKMRGSLVIVDYAHDETAMSPEPEEGEILSSGRVVMGTELQVFDGNLEEKTPPGTVHILTPNTQQEPPQSSDVLEQPKNEISVSMDFAVAEPEVAPVEVAAADPGKMQQDDPLNKFLPPPLTTKCPEELQEKINKFLAYKRAGKSFNVDLRNRKDYRNPDFLQHAVRYQDIDQIGTCFSKEVFDPHGYDKSDYYDEIEADMKREIERKDQERKKSQKVEFVAGGTQPGTVAPALKMSMQIPVAGVSAAATGIVQSVPTAADAITKDIRQNKKTKWDKIDGDVKNPTHAGGQDNLSAVGVHAVHLSTANAGAGYTAFAQQKRREAEEKRSSERKFDKRS